MCTGASVATMRLMTETVEIELSPRPESVAEARGAIGDLLEGLDRQRRDAVRLIVSELVTNAVRHGPEKPISLRVSRDGDSIQGEVEDQGVGTIAINRTAEGYVTGGFGLRLVDAVSHTWGVQDGSTRVWFEVGDHAD
jgi:anti-sigma regulatory factor (Ser/Thr protein kinase)